MQKDERDGSRHQSVPKNDRYTIAEARSRLAGIIEELNEGQVVELTRRGKSVAVLMPIEELIRLRTRRWNFATAYAGFRDAFDLPEGGLDDGLVDSLRAEMQEWEREP